MNTVAQEWWNANEKKFDDSQKALIREKIESMSDEKARLLDSVNLRDPKAVSLTCLLTGGMGIHRFMIGDWGVGFLELFTLGGCFIMGLIDTFTIGKKVKKMNFDAIALFLATH